MPGTNVRSAFRWVTLDRSLIQPSFVSRQRRPAVTHNHTNVEPLLPKISLRWLIGLVTVCSLSMAVVQQALMHRQTWSVMMTVAIAATVLPLMIYAGSFAVASFFASIGSAVIRPTVSSPQHVPTSVMPAEIIADAQAPDGDQDASC